MEIKVSVSPPDFAEALKTAIIEALKSAGLLNGNSWIKISPDSSLAPCQGSRIDRQFVRIRYSLDEKIGEIVKALADLNAEVELVFEPCQVISAKEMQTLSSFLGEEELTGFEAHLNYGVDDFYRTSTARHGKIKEALFAAIKKIPEEDKLAGINESAVSFGVKACFMSGRCEKIPEKYWKLQLEAIGWRKLLSEIYEK